MSMNSFLVPILFVISFLLLIVLIGMFYNFGRTARSQMLIFLALACTIWCAAVAAFLAVDLDESVRAMMPWLYYTAAIFLPLSLVLFANTYRAKSINPFVKYSLIIIAIGFFITLFFPQTTLIGYVDVSKNLVVLNTVPYAVFTVYFVACSLFGLRIFFKNTFSRNLNNKHKKTNWRIMIFWAFGGCFGSLFNLFLPLLGNYSMIGIGPLAVLVFIPILFTAATTDDYFSVSKVLFRGLIGCLSSVMIVVGATEIWYLLNMVFENAVDEKAFYLYGASFVVGVLWAFLIFMINQKIARQISSDGYDEVGVLSAISRVAAEKHNTKDFFSAVRHTLDRAFGVKQVNIMIFNHNTTININDDSLERILMRLVASNKFYTVYREELRSKYDRAALVAHNIEVITPIVGVIDQKVMGVILLSPRKRRYDRYYGETLEKISAILSPFIQSAIFYDQIANFNDKLKHEIYVKTKKLRENNKELVKLDEMKSDLLTIASHNLRTPLTSVLGYADMLREGDAGKLGKRQRAYLDEIMKSANTMNRVLSDFLDATRIGAGTFSLIREDLDLAELTDDEIPALTEMARDYGRELYYKRAAGGMSLNGDFSRLKQVIINLIDNAIYYGKRNIYVDLRKDESGRIVFTVRDDGIGVPKDEQHKLFTKMFRASNAEVVRPDGTGIGLYVVKTIIEASGGELIFESEKDKGSTFGFRL